jgi:hypothetical protein
MHPNLTVKFPYHHHQPLSQPSVTLHLLNTAAYCCCLSPSSVRPPIRHNGTAPAPRKSQPHEIHSPTTSSQVFTAIHVLTFRRHLPIPPTITSSTCCQQPRRQLPPNTLPSTREIITELNLNRRSPSCQPVIQPPSAAQPCVPPSQPPKPRSTSRATLTS